MLNNSTEQLAIGDGKFNQAGGNIADNSTNFTDNSTNITDNSTNITVLPSFDNFFIYEDDIKEIIIFYNDNMDTFKDIPFPNNEPIDIDKKNELNNLTPKYYDSLILDKSLPYFGKIYDFLENPRNSDFVELYCSITDELQNIIIATRDSYSNFDLLLTHLYSHIASKCKGDRIFMRKRTKVLLFLHFMYYNCDIGLK